MPFVFGLAAGLAIGTVVAMVLLAQMRRQRDRAQKAERIADQSRHLAEVGTLTGALAHEIKNPLSTIQLNLQLLSEDLDPRDVHQHRVIHRMEVVQRETARLREILDDFLRYAGKMELDRKPADLNDLLEELVDFFAPQAAVSRH